MTRGEWFLGPLWYKGIAPRSPSTSARYASRKREAKTRAFPKYSHISVLSIDVVRTKTRPVYAGGRR